MQKTGGNDMEGSWKSEGTGYKWRVSVCLSVATDVYNLVRYEYLGLNAFFVANDLIMNHFYFLSFFYCQIFLILIFRKQ